LTKANGGLALFTGPDPPVDPRRPVRKVDFARLMGITPGRVSQFIAHGLPVEADGRICPDEGERWLDRHFPNRRRVPPASTRPTGILQNARAEKETEQVRLLRLEYEKRSGRLIDRDAAEKAIFARARLEREAWQAWVTRAAPELAAELGSCERATFTALDRLVRDHLEHLQRTPLDVLSDGHGNAVG